MTRPWSEDVGYSIAFAVGFAFFAATATLAGNHGLPWWLVLLLALISSLAGLYMGCAIFVGDPDAEPAKSEAGAGNDRGNDRRLREAAATIKGLLDQHAADRASADQAQTERDNYAQQARQSLKSADALRLRLEAEQRSHAAEGREAAKNIRALVAEIESLRLSLRDSEGAQFLALTLMAENKTLRQERLAEQQKTAAIIDGLLREREAANGGQLGTQLSQLLLRPGIKHALVKAFPPDPRGVTPAEREAMKETLQLINIAYGVIAPKGQRRQAA